MNTGGCPGSAGRYSWFPGSRAVPAPHNDNAPGQGAIDQMAPRVDPVRSDEVLPASADVVIIGGGIIGTSTALFLAQKGVRAVLCEKGHIAGEQSSRNWGWCR